MQFSKNKVDDRKMALQRYNHYKGVLTWKLMKFRNSLRKNTNFRQGLAGLAGLAAIVSGNIHCNNHFHKPADGDVPNIIDVYEDEVSDGNKYTIPLGVDPRHGGSVSFNSISVDSDAPYNASLEIMSDGKAQVTITDNDGEFESGDNISYFTVKGKGRSESGQQVVYNFTEGIRYFEGSRSGNNNGNLNGNENMNDNNGGNTNDNNGGNNNGNLNGNENMNDNNGGNTNDNNGGEEESSLIDRLAEWGCTNLARQEDEPPKQGFQDRDESFYFSGFYVQSNEDGTFSNLGPVTVDADRNHLVEKSRTLESFIVFTAGTSWTDINNMEGFELNEDYGIVGETGTYNTNCNHLYILNADSESESPNEISTGIYRLRVEEKNGRAYSEIGKSN